MDPFYRQTNDLESEEEDTRSYGDLSDVEQDSEGYPFPEPHGESDDDDGL